MKAMRDFKTQSWGPGVRIHSWKTDYVPYLCTVCREWSWVDVDLVYAKKLCDRCALEAERAEIAARRAEELRRQKEEASERERIEREREAEKRRQARKAELERRKRIGRCPKCWVRWASNEVNGSPCMCSKCRNGEIEFIRRKVEPPGGASCPAWYEMASVAIPATCGTMQRGTGGGRRVIRNVAGMA